MAMIQYHANAYYSAQERKKKLKLCSRFSRRIGNKKNPKI